MPEPEVRNIDISTTSNYETSVPVAAQLQVPLSPGSPHSSRPINPVAVISSDEEPIEPNSTPRGELTCSLHPDSLHSDTSGDVMSNTAAISASLQTVDW